MASIDTKVPRNTATGKGLVGSLTDDDVPAMDRVKAIMDGSMSEDAYQGWAAHEFRHSLQLVSATSNPGSTTYLFTPTLEHCNRLGNLHGGCAATLFDFCTTLALAPIAKPGYWAYSGVSRTLNVTYLRPVPVGEMVEIYSEVISAGKRLCTIKGEMRRKRDGVILAICDHGKVSIDPPITGKL